MEGYTPELDGDDELMEGEGEGEVVVGRRKHAHLVVEDEDAVEESASRVIDPVSVVIQPPSSSSSSSYAPIPAHETKHQHSSPVGKLEKLAKKKKTHKPLSPFDEDPPQNNDNPYAELIARAAAKAVSKNPSLLTGASLAYVDTRKEELGLNKKSSKVKAEIAKTKLAKQFAAILGSVILDEGSKSQGDNYANRRKFY